MLGILVAAISGAIMSVQGVFNAEVTKQTSIWLSSAFVQISAFVVCVLAWFITGRDGADRKSTRLNSSHANESRMPSSA